MTKQNPDFVENELIFSVYRNRLHCGNPAKRHTIKEWVAGFSDVDSKMIESSEVAIYKYRPELAGWVFLDWGSASKEDGIQTYGEGYWNLGFESKAISIEEAKARFPEAFPMIEIER